MEMLKNVCEFPLLFYLLFYLLIIIFTTTINNIIIIIIIIIIIFFLFLFFLFYVDVGVIYFSFIAVVLNDGNGASFTIRFSCIRESPMCLLLRTLVYER